MKLKDKVIRISVALALAGFIAAQVPVTGVTAFAQDGYTDTDDDSGDFLGINGLSNRDVIQASVLGLVAYGVASVLSGRTDSGAAGAAGGPAPLRTGSETQTLWQNLSNDARFNSFTAAAQEVGLREPLDDANAGPFVVFAPTNAAFTTGTGTAPSQITPDQKKRLIQNHVTTGRYTFGDLRKMSDGTKLATISGEFLTVTQEDGTTKVNGTPVANEEIRASNGLAVPIDNLLVP